MPKDKSSRVSASQKSRGYSYRPYPCHGKGLEAKEGDTSDDSAGRKDWEDATCPICMDFPHNAVLLLCTSHDKGCRPYMCDTSYRHSNCLDQYQKAHVGAQKTRNVRELSLERPSLEAIDVRIVPTPESMDTELDRITRRSGRHASVSAPNAGEGVEGMQISEHVPVSVEDYGFMEEPVTSEHSRGSSSLVKKVEKNLVCPLCRGKVNGWQVVDAAREHLNHKSRSCAQESCTFMGTYEELRVHARCEHPLARPSEIDPARQRNWRRLERQRDLGDVLSTIRSAMPGATILGDFAIEDEFENDNDDIDYPADDGHWWTVFLLFQFFGPAASAAGVRAIPHSVHGHPRGQRRGAGARAGLWGENLHRNGINEANGSSGTSDTGEQVAVPSRRRHRTHHRHQSDTS